jgi:hypothetical protein
VDLPYVIGHKQLHKKYEHFPCPVSNLKQSYFGTNKKRLVLFAVVPLGELKEVFAKAHLHIFKILGLHVVGCGLPGCDAV